MTRPRRMDHIDARRVGPSITLSVGDDVIAAVDVAPPDEANEEQTYSVHFVRFDITEEQREALANLSVEHPKFQAAVPVPAELRAQLIVDLAAPA